MSSRFVALVVAAALSHGCASAPVPRAGAPAPVQPASASPPALALVHATVIDATGAPPRPAQGPPSSSSGTASSR